MHACIGCCECEKARHCIFDDDFTAVCDKFLEADLVVFATPMYYFGFSSESGYELMLDYLDWKDVGRVLAPGVHLEKAVEGIRYPADAYELGKKNLSRHITAPLSQIPTVEHIWGILATMAWGCSMPPLLYI